MYNDDFLAKKLGERRQQNAFRTLRLPNNAVDFCSNDYLGIVHNGLLNAGVSNERHKLKHGSTGSRLLSGNYALIEEVEKELALFHEGEAGLLFNSGYDANIGLLASVPQKGDTILYDQLVHASIRDGIRLSFAQAFSYLHNDIADLEKKLSQATGNIFVVTESVFSMDGDTGTLPEIVRICRQYNVHLIVDEAHGIGVVGEKGEGLVQHLGLQAGCFARVYTFGKACGCHGAVIVGSHKLRDYLINFARSFIFSTALPEVAVAAIKSSYALFPIMQKERAQLHELIQAFGQAALAYEKLVSGTPIQGVIVEGNSEVKKVASLLQKNNFDVRPILYPTVPKGKERLRIVLHAFNTKAQLTSLLSMLGKRL